MFILKVNIVLKYTEFKHNSFALKLSHPGLVYLLNLLATLIFGIPVSSYHMPTRTTYTHKSQLVPSQLVLSHTRSTENPAVAVFLHIISHPKCYKDRTFHFCRLYE